MQSLLEMQEYDKRPESNDFFFSDGELFDGAEIGRYMRHDGGQMPDGLTARGNLRLVLWEPELMERFEGSPPLQLTAREMIEHVERVCTFEEAGVLDEGDESTELCHAGRPSGISLAGSVASITLISSQAGRHAVGGS